MTREELKLQLTLCLFTSRLQEETTVSYDVETLMPLIDAYRNAEVRKACEVTGEMVAKSRGKHQSMDDVTSYDKIIAVRITELLRQKAGV